VRNQPLPVGRLSWPVVVLFAASVARAADAEQRVFAVSVDGKPAGEYRVAVRVADDGTETVNCTAAVQVRYLLGHYHYNYQGAEVWKGGRLVRLDADSDDDGTRNAVRAAVGANGLRITVNRGAAQSAPAGAWPTTYWRLPVGVRGGQSLTLLDVDTGKPLTARLDEVGPARLTAAGRPLDCTRYRVTGQAQAELWFDARGRLVREETVEDGHKTVLELKGLRRE
jgi:hypothetical protein